MDGQHARMRSGQTSTVARWARAEWGRLYVAVREPLLRRRWRALPMTLGVVCLTALVQFTQNQSWGYRFVQDLGAVRAEDPLAARPPAYPALPLRARPRPAGLGRPGADPDRLRPRRDLPRPVAHPRRRVRRHPGRHALRARGDRRGPGGLPGAARHGRAGRGHRPVGGRGGPRRVPGVALPGVRDRRCGDRRDGGGGDPEGQPRGQGAPGRHRGRTRPVRGVGDASPAHGGGGPAVGSGLPPIRSWMRRRGPAQRRSWR